MAPPRVSVTHLTVSTARPVVGHTVAVTGRVFAGRKALRSSTARTVILQSRTGGTDWRPVARTRATQHGAFRFDRDVTSTERVSYRVVVGPGQSKASRTVTVRGRVAVPARRPSRTVPPRPTPVKPAPAKPVPAAQQLRSELTRIVAAYRAENDRRPAAANACLAAWADGFAARMAHTTLFVHSGSSEWRVGGTIRLSAQASCVGQAPGMVRQEAIAHVTGSDPVVAARTAFEEMTSWWAHDDVLLDDFGTDRVMSVGVARARDDSWYVVVVFGAA